MSTYGVVAACSVSSVDAGAKEWARRPTAYAVGHAGFEAREAARRQVGGPLEADPAEQFLPGGQHRAHREEAKALWRRAAAGRIGYDQPRIRRRFVVEHLPSLE